MPDRRKYPRPPLLEALCEFHFTPEPEWDLALIGLLYARIEKEFPKRRQAEGAKQRKSRIQFLHDDERALVQVGPNLLTINVLPPYPSWEVFREMIGRVLRDYTDVARPAGLERVALRYINRIEVPEDGPEVHIEQYMHAFPVLPDGFPPVLSAWAQTADVPFEDPDGLMRLRIGSLTKNHRPAFLLDLEFACFDEAPPGLGESLLHWIDRAHDTIEESFEKCITDRARALFFEEVAHETTVG